MEKKSEALVKNNLPNFSLTSYTLLPRFKYITIIIPFFDVSAQ